MTRSFDILLQQFRLTTCKLVAYEANFINDCYVFQAL